MTSVYAAPSHEPSAADLESAPGSVSQLREVTARLWEQDVIPDYRDPGGLRVGLSPLSTSFAEVLAGMERVLEESPELAQTVV